MGLGVVFSQVSPSLLPLPKGCDALAALQINAQVQAHEENLQLQEQTLKRNAEM